MATKQVTRNIALTPHFDNLVRAKIASGKYQSASEVVREGLRLLEERDRGQPSDASNLKSEIELGWRQSEKGEVVNASAVFAEIRALSKARRAAAKVRK